LRLAGDIKATTDLEVIVAPIVKTITFNGQAVRTKRLNGRLTGTLKFHPPRFTLPDLTAQKWHFVDSLPEIEPWT
jgi:beta-galactosidase